MLIRRSQVRPLVGEALPIQGFAEVGFAKEPLPLRISINPTKMASLIDRFGAGPTMCCHSAVIVGMPLRCNLTCKASPLARLWAGALGSSITLDVNNVSR